MRWRALGPVPLGLVGFAFACLFWTWGLGDAGLWSDAELPVFDRARAELGDALSGLERSPALPDLIRARGVAMFGGALGLRLPHAVAAAAIVGLAIGWIRSLGRPIGLSLFGGAVALSLPMLSLSGRTALGNPVAELLSVTAVLSLWAATRRDSPIRTRSVSAIIAVVALGAGVASCGLMLGAGLPLAVAALSPGVTPRVRAALGTASGLSVLVSIRLVLDQGDGFIPLLGAAKDLELFDKPEARRFADGLEDFGYQVFPWAGLAMVGAATGRAEVRAPAIWLAVALTFSTGWSMLYGPTPAFLGVPAAACVVAAVARILDPEAAGWERRVALFVAAAAALVVSKDGGLAPNRLVAPTELRENEHTFPDEALDAEDELGGMGKTVFYALLVAGVFGRRREPGGLERIVSIVPPPARDALVIGAFAVAAASNAWTHACVLLPRTAALLSPKQPLERLARWVETGALPATLGVHRVRDRGLMMYGPDDIEALAGRRDLLQWFETDEPAAAIVRAGDYPALFQASRQHGRPVFVLDDSHARLRLVANRLPDNEVNQDALADIVLDEPPVLAHQTLLNFDDYIEVIGWELDGPLHRGNEHTLQLGVRVLRP
ncbi:MAG: hypothetical protein KUG77_23520, partial [Nannocystaceae bacterium]|nr:hypothetical protein [Nannocystaceae bacterium]